jgi:predicted nucleic acid-binding protein
MHAIACRATIFTIVMRFADSNVLLYAFAPRPGDAAKATIALDLVYRGDLAVSVQVLQEFYVQATHTSRPARVPQDLAQELVASLSRFPTQDNTVTLVQRAIVSHRRWNLSYWDAAIIEAARMLGCTHVLTEGLQHGQDFEGVRVVNPFL